MKMKLLPQMMPSVSQAINEMVLCGTYLLAIGTSLARHINLRHGQQRNLLVKALA